MKNWDSNDPHDWQEKQRVVNIIRDRTGLIGAVYDETIFVHKQTFEWTTIQPKGFKSKEELMRTYEIFKPDILYKKHNLIIELDGDFHFETEKGVRQTQKRNQYYEYMGVKFAWSYSGKSNKEASLMELSENTILASILKAF